MSLLAKSFSVFTQHPSTQIFAAPLCSNPCNVTIYIWCCATVHLSDGMWNKATVAVTWHHLTLVFPLLAIYGIQWQIFREICIAGVTLPKGGWSEEVRGRPRDGGEKDACSLVVLQHLQHLVSSFSHHCSLSDFCFYFWSPSFPQLSSLLPAAAFGLVQ